MTLMRDLLLIKSNNIHGSLDPSLLKLKCRRSSHRENKLTTKKQRGKELREEDREAEVQIPMTVEPEVSVMMMKRRRKLRKINLNFQSP